MYQGLTEDVSTVNGAPRRCGVLTTQGGITGIGLGHQLGREHASTPQSGVEAPRLLKRSLPRLNCCVLLRVVVVVVLDTCSRSLDVYVNKRLRINCAGSSRAHTGVNARWLQKLALNSRRPGGARKMAKKGRKKNLHRRHTNAESVPHCCELECPLAPAMN